MLVGRHWSGGNEVAGGIERGHHGPPLVGGNKAEPDAVQISPGDRNRFQARACQSVGNLDLGAIGIVAHRQDLCVSYELLRETQFVAVTSGPNRDAFLADTSLLGLVAPGTHPPRSL